MKRPRVDKKESDKNSIWETLKKNTQNSSSKLLE